MINHDKKASNLIDILATNEEYIGKLYKEYAEVFPIFRDFWVGLAVEEANHAFWLHNLNANTTSSPIFIAEGRFNAFAVQTFMDYLVAELARIQKNAVPLIEALSITSDIEQSLIESKYFEVFKTDSAELQHILTKLRDETIAHRNKAKDELEKYKKATKL
jgi:hypothetical protein